ncbi:hypothetical protein [Flavihumibacter profundi]|uniref:hypothetical protein n=1 Tax=Flavihumibacter profundi TaxID=2716883 RepID=UPI001CC4F127|nr:hypothetical protein [Flavihumibacter profundi]MBZ5859434.1 hypothetical protein [Flavihumibacter profundi]
MLLNKEELIKELKAGAKSGSLLTPKHDPNSGLTYASFRTVLTQDASSSLQELINSEEYELYGYYSIKHRKYSYALIPNDSGSYTTVGLGILSGSLDTTGSFDTFIFASGSQNGWHVYSEDSQKMASDIQSGSILEKGKLQ